MLIEGCTGVTWFLVALESTFAARHSLPLTHHTPEVQMILDPS